MAARHHYQCISRANWNLFEWCAGKGDSVYTRYALQAAALDGYNVIADVDGDASLKPEFLRKALWVVLGIDSEGNEVSQGTAFFLRGIGFVTACHVLEPDEKVASWKLIRAVAPFDHSLIRSYRATESVDIAILHSDAKPLGQIIRCENPPVIAAAKKLLVAGFPTWLSHGDEPLHAMQAVTQVKPIAGVRHFAVNAPLEGGVSGGPVLDEHGRVIGLIRYGNTGKILPNSAVDLEHLSQVVAASPKMLL